MPPKPVPKPNRRPFPAPLAAVVLCGALLVLVLHLWQWDPWAPFEYASDALYTLSAAKAIAQHHLPWLNPNLGAPYGANWLDFPVFNTIDSLFLLALTLVTHYPGLMVNTLWLTATLVTSATACWGFRRLGLRAEIAIAFGAIYALQPFTFVRGITHLNLVFYAVPLLATAAIEIASGPFRVQNRARYVWLGAFLQGFAYTYDAFFGCFLLLTAGLWAFLARKSRRDLLLGFTTTAVLAGVAFVNLLPSIVYVARRGANPGLAYKNVAEAEVYALKLRQLFTPIPDNPFPPLRAIERRIGEAHFGGDTENATSRLGTVASIGLLYLFGVAMIACFGATVGPVAGASAGLAIACILLATTGGLGALFNVFVSDDIRAYNRIIVFVSFFCLAGLGEWLTRVLEGKVARVWAGAACAVLALFAAYDQAVVTRFRDYAGRGAAFAADRDFVARAEAMIPAGGSVFELPFRDFPLDRPYRQMNVYEEAAPYIHSNGTRWSWGAMSEREGQWNVETAGMPVAGMLARLKQEVFAAVWLDRAGYAPEQSPETALTAALGTPFNSVDGRIAFYPLRNYVLPAGAAAEPEPLFVFYSTGFYPMETAGADRWRWCGKVGRIDFSNPTGRTRTVQFSMMLKTGHAEAAPIEVSVGGEVARLMVSSAGTPFTGTMTIPAKGAVRMMIHAGGEPVETAPSDPRIGLYFQAVNPKLRALE